MVRISQQVNPQALQLHQLDAPGSDAQSLAKSGLTQLETYLNASAGRSWFPGKLRLVRPAAGQDGQPASTGAVMKRELWYRKGNAAVRDDTAQYVRSLFKAAYIGKVHPHEFDRLMTKLDAYLDAKGNAFGVKAFRRFSAEFKSAESAARDGKTGPFKALPLNADVGFKLLPASIAAPGALQQDLPTESLEQTLARWETGVQAMSDSPDSPDSVRRLGMGAEGAVFEFRQGGQSLIYKAFMNPPSLAENSAAFSTNQFSGDMGVARSRALLKSSRIAAPSEFVVSIGPREGGAEKTRLMRVPAEKLKSLVNALRLPSAKASENQADIEVRQLGILMPKAAGRTVGELVSGKALTDTDIDRIATGMTRALQELDSHHTVMHDIKPDNLLYDPSSGDLKLIDLGQSQKLSKGVQAGAAGPGKDTTTNRNAGTSFYMAPSVQRSAPHFNPIPHGPEVDRHSMAVTLLELLAPSIKSDEAFRRGVVDNPPALNAKTGEDFPPEQFLEKWMERIEAKLPDAARSITMKFQANPDLKVLIQDAFCASARSPEGAQAWARLTQNPLLARTESGLAEARIRNYATLAAQARDASLPPPADRTGISVLSPQTLKLSNGASVPVAGAYRAGAEVRSHLKREIDAEMTKAAREGGLSEDLDADSRLTKMRLDMPRDLYLSEGLRSARGEAVRCTNLQEFKSLLSEHFSSANAKAATSLEQQLGDRKMANVLAENTLRDLSGFHQQELAVMAYKFTGMDNAKHHDDKRLWEGGPLDHGLIDPAKRTLRPDPQRPGSFLIGFSIDNTGSASGFNGNFVLSYPPLADDPGQRPVFSERMDIQIRYTPSEQPGQRGQVEVLDIRNAFNMVLQAVPPESSEVVQILESV